MSENGHHTNYVKVWAVLLLLLGVSIIGPEFGIRWLTLFTAFGIAIVKAYIVADKFMHINQMPKFISYIVVTCLLFMVLLFAGSAPDVMKDSGQNWVKPDWVEGTENDWVTVGHHEAEGASSQDHEDGGSEHH
jgi:caa(3)-type oxidase subunit IV